MTRHGLFPNNALAMQLWAAPQFVPTPTRTEFETKNRAPDAKLAAQAAQIRQHEAVIKPPVPWPRREIAAPHSTTTQPELFKSP